MKKATIATLKSFIRKNREHLLIKEHSRFDGMYDCVMQNENAGFSPITETDFHQNNLGIAGVWIVHGSGNWVRPFSEGGLQGYNVYNCCGEFTVAVTFLDALLAKK